MGFFSRLGTLIKSNLNDMISQSEDPEKMLAQVIVDMKQQLAEAKKRVAEAIAGEKRLRKQVDETLAKAEHWQEKAMTAVRAGDDDLARQALVRKTERSEIGGALQRQWDAQRNAVEQLKESLRHLNDKIEEAARKKNILIARKKRAEAQKAIHQTMAGLTDNSAFETFDRMADKVYQLEAEVEASTEVAGELAQDDKLEHKFAELESDKTDKALLDLKASMQLPAADQSANGEAVSPGSDVDSARQAVIDAELEALKAKLEATPD